MRGLIRSLAATIVAVLLSGCGAAETAAPDPQAFCQLLDQLDSEEIPDADTVARFVETAPDDLRRYAERVEEAVDRARRAASEGRPAVSTLDVDDLEENREAQRRLESYCGQGTGA